MQTRERDRATNLAKTNPDAALKAARLISDPFMRCQALAWAARYAGTDADAVKLAREAERELKTASDAFDAVAGAAWPVRALIERDHPAEADPLMQRAIDAAQHIVNPVRRVDALFLLVQAGWPAARPGWTAAVTGLVGSARSASSSKLESVLRDLVLMLAGAGRDFAAALAALPDGKIRRQAERRVQSREFMFPRPFFW